jgi:hypothetical protein
MGYSPFFLKFLIIALSLINILVTGLISRATIKFQPFLRFYEIPKWIILPAWPAQKVKIVSTLLEILARVMSLEELQDVLRGSQPFLRFWL